jgi:hypothetical protein
VSLRRSPTRTAAFLAANRSNARRSTGPRTAAGKARVAMNSVRRGTRAFRLRQNLAAAGAREQAALYDWILASICRCYDIPQDLDGRPRHESPEYTQQVEVVARGVFVGYQRALGVWQQAKPQSPFDARVFANAIGFRFRIHTPERTRGVAFWLQPGRGPNYFRPSRLALPGALRARLEEAWAREPEDPLAYVARLQARLGSAAHTNLWGGCRILPPTPRLTMYCRADLASAGRRARPGEHWARTAQAGPNPRRARPNVRGANHGYPGTGGAPSSPRARRRERQGVASRSFASLRPARGAARVHGFFPEWVQEGQKPRAAFAPVRHLVSGVVGALSGWVRKLGQRRCRRER